MRIDRLWIGGASLLAVALPAAFVSSTRPAAPDVVRPGTTVAASRLPVADPAMRSLFLAPSDPARAPEAADAPRLVGIIGRLPDKAVAMVRAADGTTHTLSPGQSHDGWTLTTLSPDAALFTKGARRVRSFLPAPEPEPMVDEETEAPEGGGY